MKIRRGHYSKTGQSGLYASMYCGGGSIPHGGYSWQTFWVGQAALHAWNTNGLHYLTLGQPEIYSTYGGVAGITLHFGYSGQIGSSGQHG